MHRHMHGIAVVMRSAFVVATATGLVSAGDPLGTGFTYQGELRQDGSGVSDACDCAFSLWDDPSAGTQVGPTLTFDGQGGNPPPIDVANGLFTVELDFGGTAFNGQARWLDIAVACPSGGVLQPLSPRQAITATPYALQTRGIFVNDLNNVGIGTTTPDQTLHVHKGSAGSASGHTHAPLVVENSTSAYINILSPDANERGILFGDPSFNADGGVMYNSSDTPDGLQFRVNGNITKMILGANGNVGIGTIAPTKALDLFRSLGEPEVGIGLQVGGSWKAEIAQTPSSLLTFRNGGQDRLVLSPAGNVGINKPDPQSNIQLHVVRGLTVGTVPADGAAIFGDSLNGPAIVGFSKTSGAAAIWGSNTSNTGASNGVRGTTYTPSGAALDAQAWHGSGTNYGVRAFTISPNGYAAYFEGGRNYFEGNVGIGTTAPAAKLDVVGNIQATGNVCAANIACPSDARFKTNVRPLSDALDRVEKLKPVSYDWRHEAFPDRRFSADRQVGLIAQEVKDILPEIVHEGSDGYLAVDYARLTPLLVEAVKEMHRASECKDAEIAALNERVEKLEAMLIQLVAQKNGDEQ